MTGDILTIFWKEWREMFKQRGMRGGLWSWAIMVALVGIFMPLNFGSEWMTSPLMLLLWSWPPLMVVMGLVADSIAGERERHTLETLLASRLSDRAILFGKILTMVLYGWSIEVAALLLGAITVNVTNPSAGLRFYPLDLFLTVLVISLLCVLLVSSLGVLVSLHSPTVRSAYQKMSISLLVLWVAAFLVPTILPAETRDAWVAQISFIPGWQAALVAIGVLVLADALLMGLALARFQRARLILD